MQRIGVIGAGAWGTALAQTLRRAGRDVVIWAREPEVVENINHRNENTDYLPGVALDAAIHATEEVTDALGRRCGVVGGASPAFAGCLCHPCATLADRGSGGDLRQGDRAGNQPAHA